MMFSGVNIVTAFNGAALFRARRQMGFRNLFWFPGYAFNGAALFRARRRVARDCGWLVGSNLQWGRALSSAETPQPRSR